jgi:cytochrome c1
MIVGRRSLGNVLAVGVTLLLASCGRSASETPPEGTPVPASVAPAAPVTMVEAAPAGDPLRGRELVERLECNRCHEGTGLSKPALEKDCVRCHQQIEDGTYRASAEKMGKWRGHLGHLRDVPSLERAGDRLKPEFVERFLQTPQDLRPHLVPTMPRLPLTPADARDVAAYLVRDRAPASPVTLAGADPVEGRRLVESRACGACHELSAVARLTFRPDPSARVTWLAPDLAFVRDRQRPEDLVRWLMDPQKVKPGTPMPSPGLSEKEAIDVAAFLMTVPLAPSIKIVPARLPVLERPVPFDEVMERVLGKTCRHCHGNADLAMGDGGPGNTGGFGYRGKHLSFSTYTSMTAGMVDERGQRRSVFAPTRDGTPLLVAALLARQAEETGSFDPEIRGMPLGLPALSAEEIQLVESWIAQGRPR